MTHGIAVIRWSTDILQRGTDMGNARKVTEAFFERVKDGFWDNEDVIRDLLNWLSEDEVERFVVQYEYMDTDDVWGPDR